VFVPIIPFMFNLNFQSCSVSLSWRMQSWYSGSCPLNYSGTWQWRRDYYFVDSSNIIIPYEAVLSDLLRKSKTDWWQQYRISWG